MYAEDKDACSPNNEIDYQIEEDGDITTIFIISREVNDQGKVQGVLKVNS